MEKDSKIYVAGHRGLVGSAIWRGLEKQGYSRLIGRTHAQLDLTDQRAVEQFFETEKPEYIFLAAAHVGGIMANSLYRADFIWHNLQIQNNVIAAAWRHRVKKLLFLGSTCIYPRDTPQPMPEECLLASPLEYTNEPYAIAKIAGLKMCESFNLQYGTDFIAVMPTNLYGPEDNFDLETSHVLPALLRKMHLAAALMRGDWATIRQDFDRRPVESIDGTASEPQLLEKLEKYGIASGTMTVWGSGTPLREFLWSEDMAAACIYVMEHVSFRDLAAGKGTEIRNCHLNIGTGSELTIASLVRLIADTVGYTGEIRFDASKPDGTPRKLTDPSRLHALGWHHSVEIDDGIRRLYDWYCKQ